METKPRRFHPVIRISDQKRSTFPRLFLPFQHLSVVVVAAVVVVVATAAAAAAAAALILSFSFLSLCIFLLLL